MKPMVYLERISTVWAMVAFVMGSFLLTALVLIGTTDVIGTAFFNMPLKGTVEISCGCLAAAAYLGLPYAQLQAKHIISDVLVSRFPPILKSLSFAFSLICAFVFLAYLSSRMWITAIDSWEVRELDVNMGFPIYPFKMMAFFGLVGAAWEAGRQLLDFLVGLFTSDQAGG